MRYRLTTDRSGHARVPAHLYGLHHHLQGGTEATLRECMTRDHDGEGGPSEADIEAATRTLRATEGR